MKWHFHIEHPGEPEAGIDAFTEEVYVVVENDPGDAEQFEQSLCEFLSDWFSGAKVSSECPNVPGRAARLEEPENARRA